jgi:hypothetical protein
MGDEREGANAMKIILTLIILITHHANWYWYVGLFIAILIDAFISQFYKSNPHEQVHHGRGMR